MSMGELLQAALVAVSVLVELLQAKADAVLWPCSHLQKITKAFREAVTLLCRLVTVDSCELYWRPAHTS